MKGNKAKAKATRLRATERQNMQTIKQKAKSQIK